MSPKATPPPPPADFRRLNMARRDPATMAGDLRAWLVGAILLAVLAVGVGYWYFLGPGKRGGEPGSTVIAMSWQTAG